MTTEEPFVSVVTPFYNTDEFLAECIESVLCQTYGNFEYLLIDNQSTDSSGAIAARYAERDSRIRLLRTDRFLSQIQNFNFALSQISPNSGFVKMILADDWLYPGCLSEMVKLAVENPSVGLVSAYELRETEVFGDGLPAHERVLTGRATARFYLMDGIHLFGSPTTVLYRADLVRSIQPFFEEGRLHPDTETALRILGQSDFGFVHQVLSFMRIRADSLTGGRQDYAPSRLDRVVNVKRFGRQFMDADEYARSVERVMNEYYTDLMFYWLRVRVLGPRPDFWEYHQKGLASVGERLDWKHMARGLGTTVVGELSNPGRFLGRVMRVMDRASRHSARSSVESA